MVVVSPRLTRRDGCEPADPADTVTDRLNNLLANGGDGFTLSLCPSSQYHITAPLKFTSRNQEISTQGYPTDDSRATLLVSGPQTDEGQGGGQSTAILGNCDTCSGVKIRHIQINGNRQGAPPINGGANIEIGGANADQLVEFVHSYDPRSWSCLHLAEGPFTCTNATIQNNDIGPAGSDAFQQWADGISVSCQNTIVRNNMINNPTDGGIVLFGAPGSQVYNNTIWVETHTLLGGINMVDYAPWSGNYTGTTVYNNTIMGAFSDDASPELGQTDGTETHQIMVKIGIAIGPRTWFGDQYGWNLSTGGTVRDNFFTGAFGYAMAVGSASSFTIQSNTLIGNTSFIGADGPNCTAGADAPPTPAAFVFDRNGTSNMNVQDGFEDIPTADGLTCVMPPADGDYWPFGGNPSDPGKSSSVPSSSPSGSPSSSSHHGSSAGAKAGIAIGVIVGIAFFASVMYFVPRWARHRQATKRKQAQY